MKILSWLLLFEQNAEPATDDGILNWPALFNDRLFVCVHFLKRKKNITNDETKKLINYIYTVLWGLIFQTHPKVSKYYRCYMDDVERSSYIVIVI